MTIDMFQHDTNNQTFSTGTVIFREGQLGDTMYVVLEGRVDILVRDTLIATVGPGGTIGEMALISRQPRSATAIAATECRLAPIDEHQFRALMQQQPEFAAEIMEILSERLRRVTIREVDRLRPYELRIRLATPDDLPAISHLVNEAVRVLNAYDYSRQQLESALQYAFGLDTPLLINDGTYFVAEVDGQVVGVGGWSRRKAIYPTEYDATDQWLDPATDAAKIRAFYVHPRWSRRGIGRRLLQTSEDAARAAGFTRLELLATLTGEPLYTACGFKPVAETPYKLPDGTVCMTIKMEKVLA